MNAAPIISATPMMSSRQSLVAAPCCALSVLVGDCRAILRSLPSESVQCCVTSPPYWGLRDYGHADQIGQEATPELFVQTMVEVFREVRRVLKNDGTLWLNLGDSYAANRSYQVADNKHKDVGNNMPMRVPDGLKQKDLVGIPWLTALALRADGWYLRQDIIWHKPNPMPESVTDRCTKSHEYMFLLSKSASYYYDHAAIKTPIKETSVARLAQNVEAQNGSDRVPGKTNGKMKAVKFGGNKQCPDTRLQSGNEWNPLGDMANKKSVWTVPTQGFSEAHFATYPPDLIKPCIMAGTRCGDVVLDPFGGSGTTGQVALELGRKATLIELNPDYAKIIDKRTNITLGLALE